MVDRVWQRLRELSDRGTHLTLQWVPRHAGHPGNAMADEVARAAANLGQHGAPVNLQSARAMLQRHAHREWKERIQSTRLRTGHSTLQAGYRQPPHRTTERPNLLGVWRRGRDTGSPTKRLPRPGQSKKTGLRVGRPDNERRAGGTGLAGGATEAAGVPLTPPPPMIRPRTSSTSLHFSSSAFIHRK